ncbi:Uncharacterised protein [Brucella neotomae]|uniref:Uncharacterized protein n=2 Tax=Brucella neotomae TaxID=29460 RepID=A0A7U8PX10_BRUNE|nr:predicted protein [Brucella neotomae 5K33]SPU67819.1 Uncharacterised protein [Brucella neotomae]SPU69211.1 Uncharacterised protein [Brucella neotomae]SUW39042.1 Uncharacterised protein [Brucella neotomae]
MSQPANSSAEVHAFPRRHGFNAFEQAKQELAAFKFSLFETVAADPLLRAGQCLNLIIVYASLVTIDKKTLQATPAYASNGRVFVRAGVRSHHTAVKARRLLEQHGYLIPVSRRNGITVYRIENPHHERVQMQIQELEECQREIKTEKNVRNKPQSSMANNAHLDRTGVAENAHPENRKDGNNCPPRMAESADQGGQKMPPITLKEYLTGLPVKEGYEESDGSPVMGDAKETVSETPNEPARTGSDFPANKKNGYALAANGDDENTTFSAPASIQEADDFLLALFGSDLSRLHERVLDGCRKRLMNGLLTPAFVRARIDALEKSQPSLEGASHVR